MIFDILFGLCLLIAFYRGWQKGLLWAVLQIAAVLIALPLSLKLTNSVSRFFVEQAGVESRFTFLLTFIVLFIGTMLLFRLVVKLFERTLDALMMGWINRLVGAVVYGLLLTFFFSTLVWIGQESGLVKEETSATSKTVSYIAPVAPAVIAWGSAHAPILGNLYEETRDFFQQINERIEKLPVS
jgi:membrane protein required for colicin V production